MQVLDNGGNGMLTISTYPNNLSATTKSHLGYEAVSNVGQYGDAYYVAQASGITAGTLASIEPGGTYGTVRPPNVAYHPRIHA